MRGGPLAHIAGETLHGTADSQPTANISFRCLSVFAALIIKILFSICIYQIYFIVNVNSLFSSVGSDPYITVCSMG